MNDQAVPQDPPVYSDQAVPRDPPVYSAAIASPPLQVREPHGHDSPVMGMQTKPRVPLYGCSGPSVTVYRSYRSNHSKGLGIAQIVIGALCIVVNSIAIGADAEFSKVAVGIWGGIMFIVCGLFGIVAARTQTKCMIETFMMICFLSIMCVILLFILAVIGAVDECSGYCYSGEDVALATHYMLITLAVGGAVTFIWGSVICCNCITDQQSSMSSPAQNAAMQNQPVITGPQSTLNQGIAKAYEDGYEAGYGAGYEAAFAALQTARVHAPCYPVNYVPYTTQVVAHSNNNFNNNQKV